MKKHLQHFGSPADGRINLMLRGLTSQRYTVWPVDLHKPDTSSAARSPTPEAITTPSKVKLKSLQFSPAFQESSCCTQGCHLPVSEWVAVSCGFVTQWTCRDSQGHDGPCFWTQTRKEDMEPGAKRSCGHTFLNSSGAAYSGGLKYPLESCKHCGYNITFLFTHKDVYVCDNVTGISKISFYQFLNAGNNWSFSPHELFNFENLSWTF